MKLASQILMTAACASLATAASGAQVLGINSSQSGGGLYVIDIDTGAATLFAPTDIGVNVQADSGNSLAWDPVNFRAYYASLNRPGGDRLFRYDAVTTVTTEVSNDNPVANASFWNGSYYYLPYNPGASVKLLVKVNFDAAGNVLDREFLPLTGAQDWLFGDIAISPAGILYGVGNESATLGADLFRIDLASFTGQVSYVSQDNYPLQQLAFVGDRLIGLATNTGQMAEIDVATGAMTNLGVVAPNLRINDLASIPAPGAGGILVLGALAAGRRRR